MVADPSAQREEDPDETGKKRSAALHAGREAQCKSLITSQVALAELNRNAQPAENLPAAL